MFDIQVSMNHTRVHVMQRICDLIVDVYSDTIWALWLPLGWSTLCSALN